MGVGIYIGVGEFYFLKEKIKSKGYSQIFRDPFFGFS